MLLVKNSGYTLASNILGGLVFFLLNTIVARYLEAENYGTYTFVFAFLSFFAVVANLGLDGIVVRELSKRSEKTPIICGAELLKVLFSIIAMLLSVLIARLLDFPEIVQYGVLLGALTLMTGSLVNLWWSVLQARFEMFWYAVTNLFGRIMILGITVGLILINKGVLWLVAAHAVAGVVQVCIVWLIAGRIVHTIDKRAIAYLMKESWPLMLTGLFISLYYRIDVLMLSFWKTAEDIGYYAAVYTLTEAPAMIAVAWNASLYPLLSRVSRTESTRYGTLSVKAMLTFALPMATGTALLAQPLILLIYGQGYASSIPVLKILIWAGGIIMINVIMASWLNAMGAQKTTTLATGTNLLLNAGLNFYAIPKYGITGAAVTTVATEFLCMIILGYFLYKRNCLIMQKYLLKCAGASLMMGMLVYSIREMHLAAIIPAAVLSYTALLFLFKGITKEDLTTIRELLGVR